MGQKAHDTPEYVLHIRQAAEFWINGQTGHCQFVSGEHVYEVVFSLNTMRGGIRNALKAWYWHIRNRGAKIVRMENYRPEH
jgi:hypothetical protein